MMEAVYPNGLEKDIGGIGNIQLSYRSRKAIPKPYEVKWWKRFVDEAKEGDTVIDIGAYVGTFTVILAKKVGKDGQILAFEPLPAYVKLLKRNVKLNKVLQQVEIFDNAVGNNEMVCIISEALNSRVVSCEQLSNPDYMRNADIIKVKSMSLDELFPHRKIDLLKIDTEGYEGVVVSGAANLLRRKEGYPRFIFIELHPYMWKESGVKSEDMFALLKDAGYTIEIPVLPDGSNLEDINHSWVMFASKGG